MHQGPPLKESRDKCHGARDLYFKCLDENKLVLNGLKVLDHDGILGLDPSNPDPINPKKATKSDFKQGLFACAEAEKLFKQSCPSSWVG